MTPQDKAKELVEKFFDLVDANSWTSDNWGRECAKQCALICCNEIINVYENCSAKDSVHYYQQVKEELEKL